MNRICRSLSFALATMTCLGALRSQCTLLAQPGDPVAQLNGDVQALTTWDPDGTGPLPQYLVAAGLFDVAAVPAASVALWDGGAWIAMNPPLDTGRVLTVWNGRLIVAGGWLQADEIWSFDGVTWSELGEVYASVPGTSGLVRTMTVYAGDLIVAGSFGGVESSSAAPVAANKAAKWNGSIWSALGAGPSIPAGSYAGEARAAAVFNNALWLGMSYSDTANGSGGVQVWNGAAWIVVGVSDGAVQTLSARIGTALTSSFVFAGGHFTVMNGVASPQVVRFVPTTNSWTAIGPPPTTLGTPECQQLLVRGIGISSYEVAGVFRTGGSDKAWRWTGATWVALPDLPDFFDLLRSVCLAFHGGHYVVGVSMDPTTAYRGFCKAHDSVASTWTPLSGQGIGGGVGAVCHDGQQVVIGGDFTTISGTVVNRIARGGANNWQPLGAGFAGPVNAIVRMPNGDLVAGGDFTALGDGTPMQHIARWSGASWAPIGGGVDAAVHSLAALPNGNLVVGGAFTNAGGQPAARIARWNGSSWSTYGTGCNGTVLALLQLANGDLVAGGGFTTAGGQSAYYVARWNGSAWSPMGYVDNAVYALSFGNEGIVAGGAFRHASGGPCDYVARWNGTTGLWEPLGLVGPDRWVLALATLPGGETAIGGGEFLVGNLLTCAAVFRNGAWQSLAVYGTMVRCLAMGDTLVAGGEFTRVGATVSGNLATIASSCNATAATFAPGCPSSGGSNTLTALTLPWANGVFRTEATGLPANALVLTLTSVTPIVPGVPLSQLFAEGVAGCEVRVAPDILALAVAAGGTAQSGFLLPNVPPIVGVTFYQQMVPIEFDPGTGAWLAITATNALQMVGGRF